MQIVIAVVFCNTPEEVYIDIEYFFYYSDNTIKLLFIFEFFSAKNEKKAVTRQVS